SMRTVLCRLTALTFNLTTTCLIAGELALREINPHGLRIGTTTTLTVEGDEFGTTPRLLLPFPAKQELKPGATDQKAVFEIVVDENVPSGYYPVRVVGSDGVVSLPAALGVDRLPQLPFAA